MWPYQLLKTPEIENHKKLFLKKGTAMHAGAGELLEMLREKKERERQSRSRYDASSVRCKSAAEVEAEKDWDARDERVSMAQITQVGLYALLVPWMCIVIHMVLIEALT
jgi:hypothetical protein